MVKQLQKVKRAVVVCTVKISMHNINMQSVQNSCFITIKRKENPLVT